MRHYILSPKLSLSLGGDNNLAVILGTFRPQIQCRGDFEDGASCLSILSDMPAAADRIVFGPEGAANVQQELPLEVLSS